MPQSKLSAFLSVLLVFVGGIAVGSLGYRLYEVKAVASSNAPAKKMTPEDVRKAVVAHLKDAVKLDDQQVAQLQRIMDETHDSWSQIDQRTHAEVDPIMQKSHQETQALREAQVTKVKAMLRPDQQPLYEKYLADRAARDAERKKKQAQDHKDGKGPGFPPSRP